LYELHWLPVKARITFKLLTSMYNCYVGHAPKYLTELLKEKVPASNLRSTVSYDGCYGVNRTKRTTLMYRSFGVFGPKLWNDLPSSIRTPVSIDIFKRNLKTFLFRDLYILF